MLDLTRKYIWIGRRFESVKKIYFSLIMFNKTLRLYAKISLKKVPWSANFQPEIKVHFLSNL